MHGVDLTAIESVADLQALIDDAHKEIERREAEERDKALGDLEGNSGKVTLWAKKGYHGPPKLSS